MRLPGLLALALVFACCSAGGRETSATAAVDQPYIWIPAPGTTWQWQLTGEIDGSYDVDMYDIDLFETPVESIARLQGQGRIVICYFSAGSVEDWRPDAEQFPPDVIGLPLEGWPDESWLDISQIHAIAPVLRSRFDLAVEKGCDGVEPDNVEAHLNRTGFDISGDDQLVFNRWLVDEAHARGLSIGLKNDLRQAGDLVGWFDWILVEQCVEFDECSEVEPFVSAGKAAFGAEYSLSPVVACPVAREAGIAMLFKDPDLSAPTTTCP